LEYGPTGLQERGNPGPLWKTADGHINYGFGDWANWRKAMAFFELDEIGTDGRYEPVLGRHQQDLRPVSEALARASSTRNKWDIYQHLIDLHCISGVVHDSKQLLESEQLNQRGFFVETFIETKVASKPLRAPATASKLSHSPARLTRHAPNLNEHGSDIKPRKSKKVQSTARATHRKPLDGIRVLTFTQAWSGTFGTEILALLGADVIQVESCKRPDVWRGAGAPVPKNVANPDIQQSPLNTNGMFNSVNLNKRAITLDMSHPKGLGMFWEMVPNFDIIAENFSPHVMGKWGITLETLHAKRKDMIFASISGYGQSGPLSQYPANGATTEPMSGLASIHGYRGDDAANTGGLFPDPVTGYHFAGAIIAALNHRQLTGEGQRIDTSMMEAVASQIGDSILDYSANGKIPKPQGNHHARISPHGVYPTASGEWIAIAAEDEQQWQALSGLLEISGNSYADMALRRQNESSLDELIKTKTISMDAGQLESLLTGMGVCAAKIQGFIDSYTNPCKQFLDRQYMVEVTHPETGTHFMPTVPWQFANAPSGPVSHSPRFGEHSEEVFSQELGIGAQAYQALEAIGITGTTRL